MNEKKLIENKLWKAMEEHEAVFGTVIWVGSLTLVEIAGWCGWDFAWIDTEHNPWFLEGEHLENLVRACEVTGMAAVIRVPEIEPFYIRRALEAGAQGINVPRVSSKEDAMLACKSIRFAAEGGIRGCCPNVRQFRWAAPEIQKNWATVSKHVTEETVVCCLIEDKKGVDNIEEILEVKKFHNALQVKIGLWDLSVAYGHPGEYAHPEVIEARDKVHDTALDKGVDIQLNVAQSTYQAGGRISEEEAVKKYFDMGVRSFCGPGDTSVAELWREWLKTMKKFKKGKH